MTLPQQWTVICLKVKIVRYMEHLGLELMRPVHVNQAQLRIPSGQAIFLISKGVRTMVSRQYLELSIPTLYASDLQTSVKWYQQIFGFQLLEFGSDAAAMEVTPGVFFYLSTNGDSERGWLSFATRKIADFRTHLAENNIAIEEDHGHWIGSGILITI